MQIGRARAVMTWAGAALMTVVVGLVVAPAAALALDDPPVIVGFTVDQAHTALQNWDKTVDIVFVPSLKELPPNAAPDAVLVASSRLLQQPDIAAAAPPQVEVDLGTALPDLTGLTASSVQSLLNPVELKAVALPVGAPVDWVVRAQRPPAATVVAFGSTITVVLAVPAPPTTAVTTPPAVVTAPPPPRFSRPVLVAAATGSAGLLLLVAAAATVSSVRRRRRRRAAPAERIEVRGHPGQVVGPDLHAPGPSIGIRLEPHHNSGAVVFHEEVGR